MKGETIVCEESKNGFRIYFGHVALQVANEGNIGLAKLELVYFHLFYL
jgi:hypothetical protein